MKRTISEDLARAYHDAIYVVDVQNEGIVIQVDKPSADLARLMKIHKVNSAAFLTAFNPYSIPLAAEKNINNQHSLLADIDALGLKRILGKGIDPYKYWSIEHSVLVLGIALDDAERLADLYQQNAFLWIAGDDGYVELNLRHPIERHVHED